jgi:hypothetical protein
MRELVRLIPIAGAIKSMRDIESIGSKTEERKILLPSEEAVVENTTQRSIRAIQKPKRKVLIQRSGVSMKRLRMLPRKEVPSHNVIEKRDKAEQRRKLKIGSPAMKTYTVTKSDETAIKKTETPKAKARAKPL